MQMTKAGLVGDYGCPYKLYFKSELTPAMNFQVFHLIVSIFQISGVPSQDLNQHLMGLINFSEWVII